MNRTTLRQKLTSWPKVAALCLLIVAGTLSVKLWPRTVPYEQCSDIYKKYAGTDGIKAAFVKDYKVNDTVLIDATVLEATTDSAWAVLQKDFNVPIIPELSDSCNAISVKIMTSNSTNKNTKWNNAASYIRVASHNKQQICIFHTNDSNQTKSITDNIINEI